MTLSLPAPTRVLLAALLLAGAAHAQTSPVYEAALDAGASPATAASLAAAMADQTEEALLRASNAGTNDRFGYSVALSGDRALVGAWNESGPNDTITGSGAAYVFELSGGTWTETALLRASNAGGANDRFGWSVALSGDRAIVGADLDSGPLDEIGNSGSVYVFDLSGGAWTETALLRASNAGSNDNFGTSVALSGDRVLVGAPFYDGVADTITNSGAAYVFELSGGTWTETGSLHASNYGANDYFGTSVALSGDRALVGAVGEDGGPSVMDSGAAYVFDLSGGDWIQTALLRASSAGANDQFGISVALSGDRALVGAPFEDGPADATAQSGAAYMFDLSGGTWVETILRASNAGGNDRFGTSVALSGDRALVGAVGEAGPTDETADAGAAYVFDLSGGDWVETVLLRASNAGGGDAFGASVALSGDRALVGAVGEQGPTDETDVAGAAYVLSAIPDPGTLVIDGPFGYRYLGAPSAGVTVDDLAAQNMVRGVPGYYPGALPANLHTTYDATTSDWIASTGTGEVLEPGHAFRWLMYDRVAGNPAVSQSVELPFTLSTDLPVNTADVAVTLQTDGDRFNFLANPFGTRLDLTGINGWPGGMNIVPTIWLYDPVTRRWDFNPTSVPAWQGFRVRSRPTRPNGADRVITIPASAALTGVTRVAARQAEAQPGLSFTLTGVDTDGLEVGDGSLIVAFSDEARAAFDADEDVEKFQVPATSYALIGARAGDAFLGLDVRPFAAAEIPLAVEARGTETSFTLRWDAESLPAGLPVVLVDLVTGREIDVRMASSYAFEVEQTLAAFDVEAIPTSDAADGASATDRFVLRIGSPAMAEAAVTEVELSSIAPNPSSGGARVSFAVPEAGAVRLTVLDVRGRQVAMLVDGPMMAGRHEARLDGSLAAGVYLIRLEAAGTVVTRQAVVVR